ncbi:MAG: ATP-binding cassette domain-containing protein [Waddliaceae bacterium]
MFKTLGQFQSSIIFSWIWPVSKIASRRELALEDLPQPPDQIYVSCEKNDCQLEQSSSWGMLQKLITHHKVLSLRTTIAMFCRLAVSLSLPIVLGRFIFELSHAGPHVMLLGGMLILICLAQSWIIAYYFSRSDRLHIQIQNTLCLKLFRRFFSMNGDQHRKIGKGNLLNVASEDAERFSMIPSMLIEFTHDMLTIVLGVLLLFYYLGPAALIVVFLLTILTPLTRSRGAKFEEAESAFLHAKDRRIGLLTRFFDGIKQIKLSGLARFSGSKIQQVRDQEVSCLQSYIRADIGTMFLYGAIITLVPLSAFGCYAILGYPFEASIIFPSLLVIAMLQDPFGDASYYLGELAKVNAVGERIRKILFGKNHPKEHPITEGLDVKAVSVSPILDKITFSAKAGESIAIIGKVGSGKSCLLHAIIGEINIDAGCISRTAFPIGWVSQQPVLFHGTVEENIFFGHGQQIDPKILIACCLEKDLSVLPKGVLTTIGNRGHNLSGGQIQRIALARAAYNSHADLIVLDDPLSSVDQKTEDQLIERLLFGLWKNKTVVMATHRLRHLDKFDRVILMEEGKISAIGSFRDLLQSSESFNRFVKQEEEESKLKLTQIEEDAATIQEEFEVELEEESRQHGKVKWSVWKDYFTLICKKNEKFSSRIFVALFSLSLLAALFPLAQDGWLSYWTMQHEATATKNLSFLFVYCVIGFLALLLFLCYHWYWSYRGLKGSASIHKMVLNGLVHARPRFFDLYPVGRIVQRLTRDVVTLDRLFPKTIRDFSIVIVKMVATFTILVASIWETLFIMPLMMVAAIKTGKMRNTLYRELKRLDAITRSPFYHELTEILSDIRVIRAFNKIPYFSNKLLLSFDRVQKVVFAQSSLCWEFYFFTQLLVGLLVSTIVIGAIFFSGTNYLSASLCGLLLKFTLDISRHVRRTIEGWGNAESQVTALERLSELKSTPQEKENLLKISDSWPTSGHISFRNYSARYDNGLPLVLKSVNINLPSGSKVGIIGRTGAGKSSLCQALLGALETTSGSVSIDGVDITTIPPETLRRNLGVIPQSPFFLPGDLREQVDPYWIHTNTEIVNALKQVGLDLEALSLNLATSLEALDSVLSLGQKQLLAFARVLLDNPTIIILDEATASLDAETDRQIQHLLHNEFSNQTIISVAHRFATLSDYKLIYEVSQGYVKKALK